MRAEDTTPYDRWKFEAAIRAADLSCPAKCAGYALATRADRKTGEWPMLADTLAGEVAVSRRTLFRALRELEQAGLLCRVAQSGKRGRRANRYRLLSPAKGHCGTLGECHSGTPYQPLEIHQPRGFQEEEGSTDHKLATCQGGTLQTRPCMACGARVPVDCDICASCGLTNLK